MDENIGTMVAQVARLIRRSFDERARGIGVTRPTAGTGRGYSLIGGRMIDRLQEADLVERRPDPSDRRAWRLFITTKGNALFDQLRPYANETFEIALDGIAEADRDKLMNMLLKIRSNLTRRAPVEPLPGVVRSA